MIPAIFGQTPIITIRLLAGWPNETMHIEKSIECKHFLGVVVFFSPSALASSSGCPNAAGVVLSFSAACLTGPLQLSLASAVQAPCALRQPSLNLTQGFKKLSQA